MCSSLLHFFLLADCFIVISCINPFKFPSWYPRLVIIRDNQSDSYSLESRICHNRHSFQQRVEEKCLVAKNRTINVGFHSIFMPQFPGISAELLRFENIIVSGNVATSFVLFSSTPKFPELSASG